MSSSAKALLERAAMCVGSGVISERQERAIKIIALHVIDLCATCHMAREEQTKLLLEMLDDSKGRSRSGT